MAHYYHYWVQVGEITRYLVLRGFTLAVTLEIAGFHLLVSNDGGDMALDEELNKMTS